MIPADNYKLAFGNQIAWTGTRPMIVDDCFEIEDLREWLYALSLNNEELSDCIQEIVDRLPGFVQYVKDKKVGII